MYNRPILPAPVAVVSKGKFNFGCYNAPIGEVNLLDAHKPYRLPLPLFAKNLQLREWQAFQLTNGRYFIMAAIYNAKKMALAQFIVYDKQEKKKYRYEKTVPPFSLHIAKGLYNSHSYYRSSNFTVVAHNNLKEERIELSAHITNFANLPPLEANFTAFHTAALVEPMVTVMPFAHNRGMYSHKCLMPAQGNLVLNGETIVFEKSNSAMIIDDHKGYYPYPTRYDWVTALGYTANGSLLGFNFTHNQVLNPQTYNENCLWYNGKMHPLPPITMHRPNGVKGKWLINDNYGWVNLTFTPVAHTSVNINLLLLASRYEGPHGYFSGSIVLPTGERMGIDELFGMGEQFYLRA